MADAMAEPRAQALKGQEPQRRWRRMDLPAESKNLDGKTRISVPDDAIHLECQLPRIAEASGILGCHPICPKRQERPCLLRPSRCPAGGGKPRPDSPLCIKGLQLYVIDV
jgi:hypothetical protein